PLGDDVALDECGAAGDGGAPRLVGQSLPSTLGGGLLGGIELAAQRRQRLAEVGQILDQGAEVELSDRGDRPGGPPSAAMVRTR
ncbi:hypothetical protein, partial [Pseudonocardia sp. Ae707_Ps1]|uniref:hypothetical protein n=1 Tax=Pseudonocardia sp. Ae707_Ps1 TaxID=1885572 RepID=UPI001BB04733